MSHHAHECLCACRCSSASVEISRGGSCGTKVHVISWFFLQEDYHGIEKFYSISYMWYSLMWTLGTIFIGSVASFVLSKISVMTHCPIIILRSSRPVKVSQVACLDILSLMSLLTVLLTILLVVLMSCKTCLFI